MTRPAVTAVVPVKGLAVGKSRLALPPAQRRALTAALAVDVVSCLRSTDLVADVVVVTGDTDVEQLLQPFDVRLVRDPGEGLPAAVRAGARAAAPGSALLVVPADLPFLDSAELQQLLHAHDDGFVPDRSGTGTTLLLRPPGRPVDPQYGPDSAARHAALGLPCLRDVPAGLRHDVDGLADLAAGPGERLSPCTARWLRGRTDAERRAG